MSFLQKAREAASQAAEQARLAADQARNKASDPETQERLRAGMASAGAATRQAGTAAKRGLSGMVDKIDPGLLADIVIKATALQERANAALRQKGSPYRIAEVVITATLPPQVGFSIARIGDVDETLTGHEVDSDELVEEVLAEEAAEGRPPASEFMDPTAPLAALGIELPAEPDAAGSASDQSLLP